MGNVYWRDIKPSDKVSLVGKKGERSYRVNGNTVFWHGYESRDAQLFLKQKAKRLKRG